jgi:hypothetical protein
MKSFKVLNNDWSVIVDDNDDIRLIGYTMGNRLDVTFKKDKTREIYVDYKRITKFSMQLGNHANFEGICELYSNMAEMYYNKYAK